MNKKKENIVVVSITIPAGEATPASSIGSVLGPKGVNLPGFCKDFNAATASAKKGTPTPVNVKINPADRSFEIVIKTAPTSFKIMEAVSNNGKALSKGSSNPGKDYVGVLTQKQIAEIAAYKIPDMNTTDISAARSMVEGTARSMGVTIEDE